MCQRLNEWVQFGEAPTDRLHRFDSYFFCMERNKCRTFRDVNVCLIHDSPDKNKYRVQDSSCHEFAGLIQRELDSIFQVNRIKKLNSKPLRTLARHQPRYAKFISCEQVACVCVRRLFVCLCFDRRNILANESETSETTTFSTSEFGGYYRFLLESKSLDCVQYLIDQHPCPGIKTR